MADVQPLQALHYDLRSVGSLDEVVAPPYDVIDDELRAQLAAKSPFNVVEIDLPQGNGGDPYLHAETTFEAWRQQGVVTRDREPAIWVLTQDYTGPDGNGYTRHGFFARVRVEDYGAGRIRPHERTHPGPKEDRLRLTRATRANLSPIFSLFPDSDEAAWGALEPTTTSDEPFGEATDADGTKNRLWRVADPDVIASVQAATADAELLIADGHHRYETARVYAQEVGGEGEHSFVLMFLCSLSDSGLTIFPTHRLLTGFDDPKRQALRATIERDFDVREIDAADLEPGPGEPGIALGYLDAHHKRPLRLTLKDQSIADAALEGRPEPYRRLDTAVLEAIVLKGTLGMSDDDISHKHGLDYSKDFADAQGAVADGRAEAAFFMRAIPVDHVREVAESGESMPPKSNYFFPKIPTGLVFNPLE